MTTFETELFNGRQAPVQVRDGAAVLAYLLPGQTGLVESCSPLTMYARWERVEWTDRGVSFKARRGFVEPDRGPWTLVALNQDGKPFEERLIGKHSLWLPRFVPVHVGLDPDDKEAVFKEFKIARVEERVRDTYVEGYVYSVFKVRDVFVERPEEELAALRGAREALGIAERPKKAAGDMFRPRDVFGTEPQGR
jgi:hypothetical protein